MWNLQIFFVNYILSEQLYPGLANSNRIGGHFCGQSLGIVLVMGLNAVDRKIWRMTDPLSHNNKKRSRIAL